MSFYVKDKLNIRYVDFKDKKAITKFHIESTLNKTCSMFEWKNLPTTIPQRVLEHQIQVHGSTNVFEFEGNMYSCFGNIGGELNYNYLPSKAVVANPYIPNFNSRTMNIYYGKDDVKSNNIINADMDCVVIPNDSLYMGIMPICEYYASLLTENMLTHRILLINSRAMNLFVAPTKDNKLDYDDVMTALENGDLKAIVNSNFMLDAKSLPFANENARDRLTDIIESTQYIKASWYNELGLQANYNMKREAINSNESQLNKDAILPFCDTMLSMRKKSCELINERFGTNWSVDFSSAWKFTRDTIKESIDAIDEEYEVQQVEQGGDENDN